MMIIVIVLHKKHFEKCNGGVGSNNYISLANLESTPYISSFLWSGLSCEL